MVKLKPCDFCENPKPDAQVHRFYKESDYYFCKLHKDTLGPLGIISEITLDENQEEAKK